MLSIALARVRTSTITTRIHSTAT